ncbi:transcriptional regulator [Antribacter gilvus]|uniref:transcriptional regulator n=1 Tax=Antribacter gilvus TaxID=2304675 RepID=UPI000F7AE6BA|nr:transcriptional regulator [Antribacter gilvus]
MTVVAEWTGQHAITLRRALRLTHERFAEELGTAVRTVAKWSAEPTVVPTPEIQRALDTLLSRSSDDDRKRFALLVASAEPIPVGEVPIENLAALDRLDTDPGLRGALDWIDRLTGNASGSARRLVIGAMNAGPRRSGDRAAAVTREQVASALTGYYGTDGTHAPYRARTVTGPLQTSILTTTDWLDLAQPIGPDIDDLTLRPAAVAYPVELDARAAVARLAHVLRSDTQLVNGTLYRLTGYTADDGGLRGTVAPTEFVPYALTLDLMDGELTDAIARDDATTRGFLPLRDRYLPDLDRVLDVRSRLCVGGTLALTAIARPASRRRPADYVLLVQERSQRVLNANGRLAVVPKAFHGPLVDHAEDASIGSTLVREMEEELFGRTDVDSTLSHPVQADPFHPSRLSAPMAWLTQHPDAWHMECTGFGFNLVNGNYEFADLVVIHDDEWWARFAGRIEANWESSALRRYSSLDRNLLDTLAHSPGWSNEGLFALLQGFRRLADLGGRRVDLPDVDLEL